MTKKNNTDIVLFIPETGIYLYLRSLSIMGNAATKQGKKVFLTHCTGQMSRCPMMAMYQMPFDTTPDQRRHLCEICSHRFSSAQKKYGFQSIDFADLIDSDVMQQIDTLLTIPEENWENLVFHDVPIGKLAMYDFSLEAKCAVYRNLSKEHQSLYASYIKNTAIAVVLAENINKHYNPSIFLTFNQYAQCQGVRAVSYANKNRYLAVTNASHKNTDASRFLLYEHLNTWFIHYRQWDQFKDDPISPEHVSECWNDTIFHFYGSGSHIFSSSKKGNIEQIFEQLDLSSEKKTIVVYTSSYDERMGYEKLLKLWGDDANFKDAFLDQISWLKVLRDYAKQRNDIQIIVRIHPREGRRQFGFASKHLEQLQSNFPENTPFFKIVWPDDPISSYDLLELADLCLVPWTTMGLEAARVGVPVLSCTANMYYPDDDFIQVASTAEEYLKRLDAMVSMPYLFKYLVKGIRLYHWRVFLTSLDLGTSVSSEFDDDTVWPTSPKKMIHTINSIIERKEDLIEYNIKKWKNTVSANMYEEEVQAVKRGIRQFIDKIFYPPKIQKGPTLLFRVKNKIWKKMTGKRILIKEKPFKDYSLKYSRDPNQINDFMKETLKNSNIRVIVADGKYTTLIHRGKLLRRMSPMINRLAEIYDSVKQ